MYSFDNNLSDDACGNQLDWKGKRMNGPHTIYIWGEMSFWEARTVKRLYTMYTPIHRCKKVLAEWPHREQRPLQSRLERGLISNGLPTAMISTLLLLDLPFLDALFLKIWTYYARMKHLFTTGNKFRIIRGKYVSLHISEALIQFEPKHVLLWEIMRVFWTKVTWINFKMCTSKSWIWS